MPFLSTVARRGHRIALGALLLAACSSPTVTQPPYKLQDFISAVTAAGGSIQGVLQTGPAPATGTGPAAVVSGISAAVNGGSAAVTVGADGGAQFTRVRVWITGVEDYYDLSLPAGSTAADLVLSVPPSASGGALQLRYAVDNGSGFGTAAAQSLRILRVGTGDIQVSVAWTGKSDVDLHVFSPTGEHVYYGAKTAASGGTLDLDSNPACSIDNKNNENIVWPTGKAISGTYTAEVHWYASCTETRADWVMTIQVKGQAPQIYQGSFTGSSAGDSATPFQATFTYP